MIKAKVAEILRTCAPEKVAYIDTETTGLSENDEVLELAIVDGTGAILLLERFDAVRQRRWPEAERINGISPEDVAGLPSLISEASTVSRILERFEAVVCFNAPFDIGFLERGGVTFAHALKVGDLQADVMSDAQTDEWVSLKSCCKNSGFVYYSAHTAAADALATALCSLCYTDGIKLASYAPEWATMEDMQMTIKDWRAEE